MTSPSQIATGVAAPSRRFSVSLLCVLLGWVGESIAIICFAAVAPVPIDLIDDRIHQVIFAVIASICMLGPVLFAWLVAFLPLHLFVARFRILWAWPVATFLGGVLGAVFLKHGYWLMISRTVSANQLIVSGALFGCIAGFSGAIFSRRFHYVSAA